MKDKELEKLILAEEKRQKSVTNLIASENYVSADVLAALGSGLVNKYAEGYPGKRYYGGNELIDDIEKLCQKRALKLFKLCEKDWHANVQPLSGSPANLAVYVALVGAGEKIMAMELSHGGHLTHGHHVSVTGGWWQQVPYGVNKETEQLDYRAIKEIALRERPRLLIAGYTAYSGQIDFKKFREIADDCGAYLMVDMSHIAGLVAGGAHPSPFPYADVVTTTTHKTLRGPRAAVIFCKPELATRIDKAVFPGLQGGPHQNQIAAMAVAFAEAAKPEFKQYARQVVRNAKVLAKELQKRGWRVVSGGTDTHLFLLDTMSQGVPGKEASLRLEKANIIVNKNAIPFDGRSPFDPSGIRLGTAAETTRGKREIHFIKIAEKIDKILRS